MTELKEGVFQHDGGGTSIVGQEHIRRVTAEQKAARDDSQIIDSILQYSNQVCSNVRRQAAPGQAYGQNPAEIESVRNDMRAELGTMDREKLLGLEDYHQKWFAAQERARKTTAPLPVNNFMPKG